MLDAVVEDDGRPGVQGAGRADGLKHEAVWRPRHGRSRATVTAVCGGRPPQEGECDAQECNAQRALKKKLLDVKMTSTVCEHSMAAREILSVRSPRVRHLASRVCRAQRDRWVSLRGRAYALRDRALDERTVVTRVSMDQICIRIVE